MGFILFTSSQATNLCKKNLKKSLSAVCVTFIPRKTYPLILIQFKNMPLASGEVYINDKKSAIDIKDGLFTFSKLTSGPYKISIKSKNVYYDDKLVNVDLSGSGSLQVESSPHQRILSITKFVAKSFDVCGRVKTLKESQSGSESSSNADLVKAIKIKCTSDTNPKQIQTANLDQNLNYCLQLETNCAYTIKPELSDSLLQTLKLKPNEKKVSVVDGPLFNIDFFIEQLEAKLEGEIPFLPKQVSPEKHSDNKLNVPSEIKLNLILDKQVIQSGRIGFSRHHSPLICLFLFSFTFVYFTLLSIFLNNREKSDKEIFEMIFKMLKECFLINQ
jgi:hypothetical protein